MESIQEVRSQYRRDEVMESIQEGRGYVVNTGGKGLCSQYRREGVMESIQEGRGYGVNTGRGYEVSAGKKGLYQVDGVIRDL